MRFARQPIVLACFFTRCSAGISIAISNAIMAITTKSSIKVNALFLATTIPFLYLLAGSVLTVASHELGKLVIFLCFYATVIFLSNP